MRLGDKTTFVITTDHGRGALEAWTRRGSDVEGTEAIWLAVIGPDTPALGEIKEGQYYQKQAAKTVAALLGLDYSNERLVGEALASAIDQ